ncbi:MurR/RpiR family transcriptional regulator [Streptomyces sp. NPDC049954]|uniref:MurR/RpiR family transcriptional regulator n=1 Tax=Streptomyces sp. NPDC049954 TaxID=3155779 RepID=UPI003439EF67
MTDRSAPRRGAIPKEPDTEAPALDVLVRIRGAVPSLQPAEQRVAAAVLGDPAGAARMSSTTLATQARTSVTTVMRFCRAIGLSNYPQLRIALASSAAREDARNSDRYWADDGDISEDDTLTQVVDKVIYNEARTLEDTRAQLELDVLARAVDAVAKARRIDVFGIGASGFVGQDLHQKLHRIGLMAFVWTDGHAALTASALLGEGDVALGISHSGSTVDTVEPLQAAGDRGATTIALTNFAGSPLAECADHVLTTAVREMPLRSGATASRIAQLAVVDCLFVGVAQRSFTNATTAITRTYGAVRHLRAMPAANRRPGTPGEDG